MSSANHSFFHPLLARWFERDVGEPTDVQREAWPVIGRGEHVLVTAPTGSGKTLAAFLWALNQLVSGGWETGRTRVLYVSPLKALNNDIQRNLIGPLQELKRIFREAREPFPDIRVLTRSGDTPQSDRRRMLRRPPEILITTPESLHLLVSSAGGRSILNDLSTVILDEIHAVAGNKRGVLLISAVERLVDLSGEFQRVALSATVRPVEAVAAWVGGFTLGGVGGGYTPRPVAVVKSAMEKRFDLRVRHPENAADRPVSQPIWEPLSDVFRGIIQGNRSTLLFTNSRRLSEKIAFFINKEAPEHVAYAHHGSLAREIRRVVEQKLKNGDLKAIVATSSLELGIDVGSLDEVILVQAPPSISSALQRIGRAGHGVGCVSRGTLFPTHSHDFLEAAVLIPAIRERDIEAIRPVVCPLDVLAQVIVSMVGAETWGLDELHARLKRSHPFHTLTRRRFDLVLNMLAGRYADTRIRELQPRVHLDRVDNTVTVGKGALLALYMSGGVIPDRGYFRLRHADGDAIIGDLDEEFVWEARIGQVFTLGAQNWKISRITHSDVFALPVGPGASAPPFWKAEENSRDFHFSRAVGRFLETAEPRLDDPDFPEFLETVHGMDPRAGRKLIDFLQRQRKVSGGPLPHRRRLLVEFTSRGPGGAPGRMAVLHTFWGGRVNRPYAMALSEGWKERFGARPEIYPTNDCIVLPASHDIDVEELLSLVTPRNVESLLRRGLEDSGFFGARFRECAGRALLLTRRKINERTPLWLNRLRSQKLMEAVSAYKDFPILLEAWRTCLHDEFDLTALRLVLGELESGVIARGRVRTSHPSPMALSGAWRQINEYMYRDDSRTSGSPTKLREDLLREVAFSPGLRPSVGGDTVAEFELKRQRLFPGYAPETSLDLLHWVKERVVILEEEWGRLLVAIDASEGIDASALAAEAGEKIVRIHPPVSDSRNRGALLVCALETAPRIIQGLYPGSNRVRVEGVASGEKVDEAVLAAMVTPDGMNREEALEVRNSVIGEWLAFYGPRPAEFLRAALGIDDSSARNALGDLMEARKIIAGRLVSPGEDEEFCDAVNFEILLRMNRDRAASGFKPLDIKWLPPFLAEFHGVARPADNREGLADRVEKLLCLPAPAAMWEAEILPARVHPYDPSWLDAFIREGDLIWVGRGKRLVAFCFESDLDLMETSSPEDESVETPPPGDKADAAAPGDAASDLSDLFPDPLGRWPFSALMERTGGRASALSDRLWEAAWRGLAANDDFAALRRGIQNNFKVSDEARPLVKRRGLGRRRKGGRSGFNRWKGSRPTAGNWRRTPRPDIPDDPLEMEELKKDRARLLLDRHGILFRELLLKEPPGLRWRDVFRSLRLMELSGEVISGCFFHQIPGPQFISRSCLRILQNRAPKDAIFWMHASDPASLCGAPLPALKTTLPKRAAGTHLVYHGPDLVVVSRRRGKTLEIHASPDAPDLPRYFGFMRHLLTRTFQPMRRIAIEIINDEPAAKSPFLGSLRTAFDVDVDHRTITVFRKR